QPSLLGQTVTDLPTRAAALLAHGHRLLLIGIVMAVSADRYSLSWYIRKKCPRRTVSQLWTRQHSRDPLDLRCASVLDEYGRFRTSARVGGGSACTDGAGRSLASF